MKFKGWQKESLIEWPGKICTVVFLPGCNFRCPFCYNTDLVLNPQKLPDIDEGNILNFLKRNRNLLDGLMITGGEPLKDQKLDIKNKKLNIKNRSVGETKETQSALVEFIKKIKEIGLGVGIETNGANPKAIEYLIKNNLVNYVAMDIKAPLRSEKYRRLAGVETDLSNIKKSIKIIIDNPMIDYEFRTTVVPGLLNQGDILSIARSLKGAKVYYLQQFRSNNNMIEKKMAAKEPYSPEWFKKTVRKIKNLFKLDNVKIRI